MERPYEEEAKTFCNAIKTFATNPDNLENLENYLAMHFATWMQKYANTPENIASEMSSFAEN